MTPLKFIVSEVIIFFTVVMHTVFTMIHPQKSYVSIVYVTGPSIFTVANLTIT